MNKKHLTLVLLISFALLERLVFDLGPNIELVTSVALISAMYLGSKYSTVSVFIIMALSDMVLGNTNIFLFTWSGFLIPAALAHKYFKGSNSVPLRITKGSMAGIYSSIFFFIWTNFGVWLLATMYPHNLTGLMQSYAMGLPFLKMNLISTLLLVPSCFVLSETFLYAQSKGFLPLRFGNYLHEQV